MNKLYFEKVDKYKSIKESYYEMVQENSHRMMDKFTFSLEPQAIRSERCAVLPSVTESDASVSVGNYF